MTLSTSVTCKLMLITIINRHWKTAMHVHSLGIENIAKFAIKLFNVEYEHINCSSSFDLLN